MSKDAIEPAVSGFDEAVKNLRQQCGLNNAIPTSNTNSSKALDPENTSSLRSYVQSALTGMEDGRKAVQEKIKLIIPTVIGTFVASASIAAFAFRKDLSTPFFYICLLLAGGTSAVGIFVIRSLVPVLEATYEYYVATIIHAAVVLKAARLHHPWTELVDANARRVDEAPQQDAETIRDNFRPKRQTLFTAFMPSHRHNYDDAEENNSWSRRLLEKWKAAEGNLLSSYSDLLFLGVKAHLSLIFLYICIFSCCLLNAKIKENAFHNSADPGAAGAINSLNEVNLAKISDDLSNANLRILIIKTNLISIVGK